MMSIIWVDRVLHSLPKACLPWRVAGAMLNKCGFAAHLNIELAVGRVRPISGQGLLLCRAYPPACMPYPPAWMLYRQEAEQEAGSERTARSTTDTK
jgi:hypothetical protein